MIEPVPAAGGAPAPLDDAALRFPSLASLRAAHSELLRRQKKGPGPAALHDEVEAFVRRGRATGALLDESEERWEAQSILDYWATHLFRADRTAVDALLDDFDADLAPALDDADCPYVGLDAFRESQAEVFFGRGRAVEAMVERLAAERFLAVVGDSGSGKSSVVLAGLLPALRAGALPGSASWRYLPPLVPGSEPLASLARAFAAPDTGPAAAAAAADRLRQDPRLLVELASGEEDRPCVLVVDQFEEVFTLCDDEAARQAFSDALAALAGASGPRHTVLLTLRSDYESRMARLASLQGLFERVQVRATPLAAAELREAIVKPAELVGLKFEEGVVDALLRDTLGEPAGLPLLQFTLLKLWEGRERNRVTWEAYRRLGGGRLALARSADDFYAALIPEEQVTARRILLRMVRPSEGLEVTSSRVRREAVYRGGEDPGRVDRVLEKLAAARLVRLIRGETAADEQVEVAHEALVRNWPRLVEWLEEERAEIAVRRRLEALVVEWLRLGKQGGLLDAVQLAEAERWLAGGAAATLGYHDELPALVAASGEALAAATRREEEARQRELDFERRRAEAKARSSRVFRLLATVLAALLIVSLWSSRAALVAQRQARDAERAQQAAQLRAASAEREIALRSEQRVRAALARAEEQRQRAEAALEELQKQTDLTRAALAEATVQRQRAEEALASANQQRERAEAALREATVERDRAQESTRRAEAAQRVAEEQRMLAERALAQYQEQKEIANRAQEQVAEARSGNVRLTAAPERGGNRVLVPPRELRLERRARPLRLGASVSSLEGGVGSLCCLVKDAGGRSGGRRYLLSLAFIFEGEPGAPVVQPGRGLDGGSPEQDRVGILTRVGRDRLKSGAIARLDPGIEVNLELPQLGKIRGIEQTVRPGDVVRLVGRSSGIVEGRVIQVKDGEIITSIVPSGGDAGGPVLSDDNELAGILWGSDKTRSFVLPIIPILRELGVELVE